MLGRWMIVTNSWHDRFRDPVPGSSVVQAQPLGLVPPVSYEIEHRWSDGPWMPKCRYGSDLDFACYRVRYWNRLCRGRRTFRVVSVSGASRSVIYGDAAGVRHG